MEKGDYVILELSNDWGPPLNDLRPLLYIKSEDV